MQSPPTAPTGLTDPEDAKLVTLARSTRARAGAAEGACLRDLDGRTHAGATVSLPGLELTAVQVAVAMAVTSGARGIEAVVVLGDAADTTTTDLGVLRDFAGATVPVHLVAPDGTVVQSRVT
ncbi:cytidine deaminase [soil metagenome]